MKRAKSDKEIPMEELGADVYSQPLETLIRGVTPWDFVEHKRLGGAVNLK